MRKIQDKRQGFRVDEEEGKDDIAKIKKKKKSLKSQRRENQ